MTGFFFLAEISTVPPIGNVILGSVCPKSTLAITGSLFNSFLVLITLSIARRNYTPGTFLSGWDTLHPEFNFGLYLKRVFWGVWREHQGIGAVASQAHAAELTRIPILFLLSLA